MAYFDGETMNRNNWEFEYTAKTLADAADKKASFREGREAWWRDQYAKVMTEVKESGIEVSESVAASYSNSTRVSGPQVMVRTDLQSKLSECHQKIKIHNQAARDYRGWSQVLKANSEARLKLKHGDWLYFFGDEVVGQDASQGDDE